MAEHMLVGLLLMFVLMHWQSLACADIGLTVSSIQPALVNAP